MGDGVAVASACASATVVNAIATGRGAAFGVDLRVQGRVRLTEGNIISGRLLGMRKESSELIEICVRKVLEHFRVRRDHGAIVETRSDIPIAAGLSSSSAAANAVVLATFAALGETPRPELVLNLGIDAAFEAGVTITGALDDAAASFYGNGVVTDNKERRILKRFEVDRGLEIVIHVPPARFYTSKAGRINLEPIRRSVDEVHRMALRGEIWKALTTNGLLYATSLGHEPMVAIQAMSKGALAAGLTGTGPATVAVSRPEDAVAIAEAWRHWGGRIIIAKPAVEGARTEWTSCPTKSC